jgi:ubiquitin carboxyl-terminal hydrolase 4/11/15
MTTPAEERRQVREAFEKDKIISLKPGQKWYILSTLWFNKWSTYVDYMELNEPSGPRPGMIDNTPLIDKTIETKDIPELYKVALKEDLSEHDDYYIVSSQVWDLFYSIYGSINPPIERHVVAEGETQSYKRVEIYPLHLYLQFISPTKVSPDGPYTDICVSKKTTISELKPIVASLMNITTDFRLWGYPRDTAKASLLSKNYSLEASLLSQQDRILIECQTSDNTWPLDDKIKKAGIMEDDDENYSYSPSIDENGVKKSKKFSVNLNFLDGMRTRLGGYGSTAGKQSKKKGLCGLRNLGNTCFMNSALQCLSNTAPLNEYFISNKYKDHINKTNPLGMQGKLAREFGELIKEMWSGSSVVSPVNLKYIIGQFAPQFSGFSQNDSQELLAFLLDGLHEDLNQVKKKPYIEIKDEVEQRPDIVVAKEQWEIHLLRNRSIIVDLFQGQLKSTLKCPVCEKISIKFDPFMYLSLPIPTTTSSAIDIIVMPENDVRPIKFCVETNKKFTISTLKEKYIQLSETNRNIKDIVIADMNGFRINCIMEDYKSLSQLQTKDKVLLFAPSQEYKKTYFVTQRLVVGAASGINSPYKNCGIPFVIFMGDQATNREIWTQIWRVIRRMINIEKVEGEDEQDALQREKAAFKISLVNLAGYFCGNPDCRKKDCFGCEVPFNDETFELLPDQMLSVDWNDASLYINKESMTVSLHSTVSHTREKISRGVTLDDCLDLFSEVEKLGPNDPWYCPKCKKLEQAYKKFEIWSAPEILVVHLKRFGYSRRFREKINTYVDFPVDGLDISPFMVRKPTKPMLYDLFAISNHMGGMGGGHYTAYAKNYIDGGWYSFNDSSVTTASAESIKTASAYLLFYQRRRTNMDDDTYPKSPVVSFDE